VIHFLKTFGTQWSF